MGPKTKNQLRTISSREVIKNQKETDKQGKLLLFLIDLYKIIFDLYK